MRTELSHAAACRAFAMISALVCGMLTLRLYGQYLEPKSYGIILIALQLVGYLPFLDGGFRTVLNRRMLATDSDGEKDSLRRFGQSFYSWLLLAAMACATVMMLVYFALTRARDGETVPSFWLFAAIGVAGSLAFFANAQAALLIGLGAQAKLFLINGASSWLVLAALWSLLEHSFSYWAFPLSMLAGGIGTLFLAFLAFMRAGKRFAIFSWQTGESFKSVFHTVKAEAWQSFRSQLAIFVMMTSDVVLVGIFCAPEQVAVYGIFSRLIGITRGLLQSLPEASWPLIARARGATHDGFADWLVHTIAWLHGFAAGGIVILAIPFIQWYMGSAWSAPTSLAVLLTARFLVIGASSSASYYFYGTGDFRLLAKLSQREALVAIVLSVLLAPALGMEGIAMAYLASTCAGTFIPMVLAYSSVRHLSASSVFARIWLRAGAGSVLGAVTGFALLELANRLFRLTS